MRSLPSSPLLTERVARRLGRVDYLPVMLVCVLAAIGTAMLYSVAHGSWEPWALNHVIRFGICLLALFCVTLLDISFWWRQAYVIYFLFLALLVSVELVGFAGMGAQRWIAVGGLALQPSELMKLGLVLALARYFHDIGLDGTRRLAYLVIPVLLIAMPCMLVVRQPDLGTAAVLVMIGAVICFLAGVRLWTFGVIIAGVAAAVPVVWSFLRPYQKNRIMTFLEPNTDPLGAGYHIIQSKTALGSGGVSGTGFLQGSQSRLDFLPEQHTDFIFTVLAEEFGLVGGLVLITLYLSLILYGIVIGLQCRNHFMRLVSLGVSTMIFLYLFINIAMVMGLVPVVGVPLPLISFGGSAMMTLMIGTGLIMSARFDRDVMDIRS